MPRPAMVICYICGREFGTKSIGIHEPQCLQKWKVQNDALPPNQRQPAPVKPQPIRPASGGASSGGRSAGGGGGGGARGGPTEDLNDAARAAYEANLRPCSKCSRRFAMDRIQVHEKICRSAGKKRPTFNAFKQRTRDFASLAVSPSKRKSSSSVKNHWREKHEEFINNIRYAKQADGIQKKGGNLKNLPPPPRSTNPDYIQCPHCSRRFAPDVAQRHIPSCANTVNKPKGPPRQQQQQQRQQPPSSAGRSAPSSRSATPSGPSRGGGAGGGGGGGGFDDYGGGFGGGAQGGAFLNGGARGMQASRAGPPGGGAGGGGGYGGGNGGGGAGGFGMAGPTPPRGAPGAGRGSPAAYSGGYGQYGR